LAHVFSQVVDALFRQVLASRELWELDGERPQPPPIFKCCNGLVEQPQLSINYEILKQQASEEFSAQKRLILEIFPERRGSRIEGMFQRQIL